MLKALDAPRTSVSEHAPRLVLVKIPPDKIGMLIGPGGRMIRSLQEETGTTIDVDDDGVVTIAATAEGDEQRAKEIIERMTEEIKVGKLYEGKVISIKDFGAFVEVLPGQDGLVHISELDDQYVESVSDVVKIGDTVKVKVIGIDEQNRVKLSRKAVLREEKGLPPSEPRGGGRRSRDDRGSRGGGGPRSRH
jgi:polyribonucleotide nucleotidyltransferase